MIEVSLDFMNYNFILLLLIIAVVGVYFYYELRNIKKSILLLMSNINELNNKEYKKELNSPEKEKIPDKFSHDSNESSSSELSDNDENDEHETSNKEVDITDGIPLTEESTKNKLDFIVEIPDLINGELTIDKIDNIMSSDDENDKNDENDENDGNIDDYNIETGEVNPNFIYDDNNNLKNKSISELKKILEEYNLPLTGNKNKLIERIINYKK